jgi:hypothetical protein
MWFGVVGSKDGWMEGTENRNGTIAVVAAVFSVVGWTYYFALPLCVASSVHFISCVHSIA